MRICINKFLKREIELFPNYTIFALGNRAFEVCSFSFPKHFIVGIPHPTGSRGYFDRLKKKGVQNPKYFIKEISAKKDKRGNYKAIQLSKI